MELNFKCPLCETYFDAQDDLAEHVKAAHTSYYYDTYLVPAAIIDPITLVSPTTVITSEPVGSDVFIEPDVPVDTGCDCDCFGCCSDGSHQQAATAVDADGECCDGCDGCGDCDCDCVIM